jgi:hypothetical protein
MKAATYGLAVGLVVAATAFTQDVPPVYKSYK